MAAEKKQRVPKAYCGKILNGEYSEELTNRVAECISAFQDFDATGASVIPYISAWEEGAKIIWYEFAGKKLCDLFDCPCSDIPDIFKEMVIDQRVYEYVDIEPKVQEEIITRQQMSGKRSGLRNKVKEEGAVEAVYKIALSDDKTIWFKDRADIETFDQDNVCISLGTLTDVSKEMDHKELLEKIGYFDELTKLPKRKILHRILEMNMAQVQRKHLNNFVFLMIDIDHFKQVNDTYGHQAGDYTLATLAELMTLIKRKEDEFGRYAGEEFYGVSHGNIENGYAFAERVREKIEQAVFTYNGQDISITISIGVAAADEVKDFDANKLIQLADKRLYAAKQQGRNRVVSAGG